MNIFEITEDNIEQYGSYIDPDAAEYLAREYYHGFVNCDDEEPVAAIIYEILYSEDDNRDTEERVIWLRIDDDAAGQELLDSFCDYSDTDSVSKIICDIEPGDKDRYSDFFVRSGFSLQEIEDQSITVTLGDFREIRFARSLYSPEFIKSLDEIGRRTFRRGLVDCVYNINRVFPDDLTMLPIEWFDTDISCFDEADGQSYGFLLFHRSYSGIYHVELLADWGTDAKHSILFMIRYSLSKAYETLPDDTKLVINRYDAGSKALCDLVFPGVRGEVCIRAVRMH